MRVDVAVIGGGIGGSSLATALARRGHDVLVLEREEKFRDRVRGENMLPWGVSVTRRMGILDDLVAAGGHRVPFFNVWAMGEQTEARPLPETTPHGESSLNMYHPDLQEAALGAAMKAGARVERGATVQGVGENGGGRTVTFSKNGQSRTVTARVVVGADGRASSVRQWGAFTVARDPGNLRIAGTLLEGTQVPDTGTHLCFGPGFASFIAPLGRGRARTYFVYPGATGDRRLSGRDKGPEFLESVRATRVPAAWFEDASVTGPLAEFEGADHWVPSPAKQRIALVGDAAGATDPSWGCGLSKTMVDVETLARHLDDSDDWDLALDAYAKEHDEYYTNLHAMLGWMTELFWTPGPAADERRQRVIARMRQDPSGYPDVAGQGPFGPCDEAARRNILGLD